MAPIPSRLPEEVVSLLSSAERRYKRITESTIPELRGCIGPVSVQQRLAEDAREETLALSRQIEALDMMVDDQQGEKNRRELREVVNDLHDKLETLKKDTRAALLASKRAMDLNLKSKRDELFARPSVFNEKKTANEKTAEDALMQANSDVTDALRRTISLMQAELERSVLSTQLLDESTATLRSTSLQHDTLNTVMSTSKHLVTALEKSDWLDRILILSGLAFFVLVVLFILKQRIVDRGLRIAFWWTRFVPSFGGDAELLANAEKGMASAVVEASASLSAAASALTTVVASSTMSSLAASLPSVASVSSLSSTLESAQDDHSSPTSIISSDTDAPVSMGQSVESASPPVATPYDSPIHVEL